MEDGKWQWRPRRQSQKIQMRTRFRIVWQRIVLALLFSLPSVSFSWEPAEELSLEKKVARATHVFIGKTGGVKVTRRADWIFLDIIINVNEVLYPSNGRPRSIIHIQSWVVSRLFRENPLFTVPIQELT